MPEKTTFNRKKYMKEYRREHKEHRREYHKQWRKDNPEKVKGYRYPDYQKQWEKDNSEKREDYQKQWRKVNPEYNKQYLKQWKENNPEYIKEYYKNKCRTDIKYNLNHRMKTAIGISLKGNKNNRHWENLVRYTLTDLIKHLKKTMPVGYAWKDFLEGKLHIDHIIPISVFNYTRPEHIDFKRCWSLENLQLLPASENCSKQNKLYRPFQPALMI